ncbi:hypothetical protein [Flavobacterium pedocola]
MKVFFRIIIGVVVAYFLAVLAFLYEERYRKLIRKLYGLLTENKITFEQSGKYFHFPSGTFIFAFVLFSITLFLLLKRQNKRQRIKNIVFGILLLAISTFTFCFLDSVGKLAECTACNDGKRVLGFNAINYDLLFVMSLLFAILPTIVTEIKNRNQKKAVTGSDFKQ